MASHVLGTSLRRAWVGPSNKGSSNVLRALSSGILPETLESETERVRAALRSVRDVSALSAAGYAMAVGEESSSITDVGNEHLSALARGRDALKAYDELVRSAGPNASLITEQLGVEVLVIKDELFMTREQRLSKVKSRIEHVRESVQKAEEATIESAEPDSDDFSRNISVSHGRYAIKAYDDLVAYARTLDDKEVNALVTKLGTEIDMPKMKKNLYMSRKQRVWMGWRGWF